MSFINERIPQKILAGFSIGPRWQNLVVPMDNGGEVVNAEWQFPKYEARGSLGAFSPTDLQTMRNLFMACRGTLHAFRVRDPLDYSATAQPLYTVGGVTYLSKAYTYGTETAHRLIHAPVTATLSGSGSVNLNTGVVTGADPEVDTWTGTFDIWMRFQSDWNALNAVTANAQSMDIELVERWRR